MNTTAKKYASFVLMLLLVFVMIFSTYVVTNNHVKRSIVVTEGREGIIWTEKLKTH